jgi:hypothetical protein
MLYCIPAHKSLVSQVKFEPQEGAYWRYIGALVISGLQADQEFGRPWLQIY